MKGPNRNDDSQLRMGRFGAIEFRNPTGSRGWLYITGAWGFRDHNGSCIKVGMMGNLYQRGATHYKATKGTGGNVSFYDGSGVFIQIEKHGSKTFRDSQGYTTTIDKDGTVSFDGFPENDKSSSPNNNSSARRASVHQQQFIVDRSPPPTSVSPVSGQSRSHHERPLPESPPRSVSQSRTTTASPGRASTYRSEENTHAEYHRQQSGCCFPGLRRRRRFSRGFSEKNY
ncbi:uncharacterized protein IL334_004690 [Kwoniella shivajii]|uniref:Uncharacterized protein n=1 Tax=Kwoniella shivajii TaxID=564305 RepID=A0ABZ1D118_9TREE|nr:hypothetical protein IL334_004690 [Kwoniella shivajii]